MITWDTLSPYERDIIDEVSRQLERGTEPEFSPDQYASMLLETVNDVNMCMPMTEYAMGGTPVLWRPLLMLGVKRLFYFYMIDKYVEVPELIEMHGSYANIQTFMDRWERRYDKLNETYQLEKKKFKMAYYMPGMRLVVDNYAYGLPPVGPVLARPGSWHP